MPSGPNYIRDYVHERLTESPKRKRERALRNRARRALQARLGRPIKPGYDVDHIRPLDKGGSNLQNNLRERRASQNRAYPRNSRGGIR